MNPKLVIKVWFDCWKSGWKSESCRKNFKAWPLVFGCLTHLSIWLFAVCKSESTSEVLSAQEDHRRSTASFCTSKHNFWVSWNIKSENYKVMQLYQFFFEVVLKVIQSILTYTILGIAALNYINKWHVFFIFKPVELQLLRAFILHLSYFTN